MTKWKLIIMTLMSILLLNTLAPIYSSGEEELVRAHKKFKTSIKLLDSEQQIKRFTYDSGLEFTYPDAVRGIYVTGNSADGSRFDSLVDLVDQTDRKSTRLNSSHVAISYAVFCLK